ncbi:hypothetical protein HN448_04405 [archaeon]|jgi:hypothetical protein|nr:hypothetical protein [archaeon]
MIKEIGKFKIHESELDLYVEIDDDIFLSGKSIDISVHDYNLFNKISLNEKDFKKLMILLRKIEETL